MKLIDVCVWVGVFTRARAYKRLFGSLSTAITADRCSQESFPADSSLSEEMMQFNDGKGECWDTVRLCGGGGYRGESMTSIH